MRMTNKVYDTLKIIALVAVPVTVLITSILTALNVPNLEVITAILAAIDTFLGSLVEIARREYEKENGNGETDH